MSQKFLEISLTTCIIDTGPSFKFSVESLKKWDGGRSPSGEESEEGAV